MEKRYQVFISSTFTDLIEERQAVLRAILELDHMPAGMELFPALDESAWQLIKDVIDASDYYVLIVGGRYGSPDEAGIGYTEKEYDYAVATKKPVIALLHENPDNLPRGKTETQEEAWKKLKRFRSKIEKQHTCVYWKGSEDLKAKVIVGLTATAKRHPAVGWIRADQVPSDATLSEMLTLRNKIAELEASVEADKTKPPVGTENLQQGEDVFSIKVDIVVKERRGDYYEDFMYSGVIMPTWNQIFAFVAPSMILETSDNDLRKTFKSHFQQIAINDFKDARNLQGKTIREFRFKNEDFDTCIVQLRALGLITESRRQRSIKDTETYWTLTPYGDHIMVQLRALQKEQSPQGTKVSKAKMKKD